MQKGTSMNSDSLSPSVPRIPGLRDSVSGAAYKKGDVIGQKYEVYGILGAGGFGIVFLVYSHETKYVYALKTFRDEYLADSHARERFRKEASVWVDLERHPYLVRASYVEEVAGRLFVVMEHIAPDEHGLNTLEGYLRQRPPDLAQSLRWAIQFCYGMEYAYSKGIRCHRDIKPANIMISQDKTVKITDFGLAGVLGPSQAVSGIRLNIQQGTVGLSGQTMEGTGFGTPTHMSPEQFTDAASCDERSDIYSFGVVLFQMASGGRLPFLTPLPEVIGESESARFWREMHRLHTRAPVPKLNSPLFSIIHRCMEKEPGKRYRGFEELRGVLEPLLRRLTGEAVRPTELGTLEAWEWSNKGFSLDSLGRHEEALRCFDKALELDPRDAAVWNNKGTSLGSLGRHEEAIRCYDKALELDPQHTSAWYNKGTVFSGLRRHEEAIRCYDKALELDSRLASAWENKGTSMGRLGRQEEAIRCYDKALELDPRDAKAWRNKGKRLADLSRYEEALICFDKARELEPQNTEVWYDKGFCLHHLSRYSEAIRCFDKALELDPRLVSAWNNKAVSLSRLGRHEEQIRCYDKALELDPQDALTWHNKGRGLGGLRRYEEAIRCIDKALELDPQKAAAWYDKGFCLHHLNRYGEAIHCFDEALELDPRDASTWYNKGSDLHTLGRYEEAIRCFDKASELDPRNARTWYNKGCCLDDLGRPEEAIGCFDKTLELDPRYGMAWYARALAQEKLGRRQEAVQSYRQFIALAPAQHAEEIAYARQRVRELEAK